MPDLNDSSLASPAAAPTPAAQPQTAPGRARRWLLWGAAVLIGLPALLTALLTWWLPDWARPRIEAAATEALGTPVQLGRIELTPWQLDLRLHDLQVGPAEAPLARLGSAHVQLAAESLWRGAPVLRRIELVEPSLWLRREAPERYNFSAVLAHLQARQARTPRTADSAPLPPPRFALHNITLQGGQIHLQDDVLGQRHDIAALQIGLPFISNLPSDVSTEVQPQLQATVDGSALQLKAQARPFAPGQPAQLQLDWRALALQPWLGLLKPLLPAELAPQLAAGTLDAALNVDFEGAGSGANTPAPRLLVRGNVTLNGLDLALPGLGSEVRWNKLQLRELTLAPLTQDYQLAAIEIDGLDAHYTRQAATTTRAAPPAAASAAAHPASAAASATAAAAQPALHWQIGALQCRACRIQLHDTLVQPATRITLQDINLDLHQLDSDPARPILFTLAAGLASAVGEQPATPPGTLHLKGQLQRSPLAAQADVQLGALDLQVLQPYLAPHVNLVLVAGRLGTHGQLQLGQPAHAAQPNVQYAGQLDLAGLRSRDRLTGDEFVRWQQLGFDGLQLGWQAGALQADLGQVRLSGLDARVILHPDGHLNLADVVRRTEQPQTSLTTPQTAAARAPQAAASAGSAAATTPKAELPDLRWQAIRINDSELRFSDHFIRPNYSARLTRLQGSVSALSARSPAPARVELAGALDDGAPLHIAGQLHPLGPQLYTDIEASAHGIALPRLSAYAERYAGYGIEKGSMSVTLHYRIEQGKLQAEHQLVLNQLTFGAPVERPGITQLPVRLAAALLQDRHGVIDLQLPVAGTLDDPQFSVGAILWKVLVNLVSKAVTAPFALLMGNDGEAAGQIDFVPGSAELDAAARTRLDSLAERLADRPGVRIEATGQADLQRDAEALQHQQAAPAAAPAASGVAPITEDALRALADERATQVMAYLTRRLPAERILLNRSTLLPDGATHVQLKLH